MNPARTHALNASTLEMTDMRTVFVFAALLTAGAVCVPGEAQAIGCVSGAAAGGVAGHFAGHHGLLGAAAGCAVGHHEAAKHRRAAAHQQQQQQPDQQ